MPATAWASGEPNAASIRLEDGKLAEHWATFDALGMLGQLGMVPVPKPPLLFRTLSHQLRKLIRRR